VLDAVVRRRIDPALSRLAAPLARLGLRFSASPLVAVASCVTALLGAAGILVALKMLRGTLPGWRDDPPRPRPAAAKT
jgi:hypothetical protein